MTEPHTAQPGDGPSSSGSPKRSRRGRFAPSALAAPDAPRVVHPGTQREPSTSRHAAKAKPLLETCARGRESVGALPELQACATMLGEGVAPRIEHRSCF